MKRCMRHDTHVLKIDVEVEVEVEVNMTEGMPPNIIVNIIIVIIRYLYPASDGHLWTSTLYVGLFCCSLLRWFTSHFFVKSSLTNVNPILLPESQRSKMPRPRDFCVMPQGSPGFHPPE